MNVSWLLLAYAVCNIVACGTLGAQGVLALRGHGTKVSMPAAVLSLAFTLLSAVFAVVRLGRVDRVLNVFGNPASSIAQSYYAIVLLAVVAVVVVVALRRSEDEGQQPVWCAALSVVAALVGVYALAASITATVHNAAKTWLTVAYVLCAAVLLGTLVCTAIEAARTKAVPRSYGVAALAGAVATGVMTLVYAFVAPGLGLRVTALTTSTYGIVPGHPSGTSVSDVAAAPGVDSPVFWVGAVAVGVVVPLVLSLVTRKVQGVPRAVACGVSALAALVGVGVTFGLFAMGSSAIKMFM